MQFAEFEYNNGILSRGMAIFGMKCFVSNGETIFNTPKCSHAIAIVINDSDKPLRERGMVFPNDLSDYVYKRSFIDRIFGLRGKPAIPPRSQRLALLKRHIKAQCIEIARSTE